MNYKNKPILNSFPLNKRKEATNSGFTLVELIVVITILAILGTIAFISLQGYSASSRDSVRISDVGNMKTSLELFHLNAGKYPLPDNGEIVSYSGQTLRTQGDFGETVTQTLSRNLNETPTDPLSEKKYIYSVSNNRNEFELLSLFESDIAYNPLAPLSGGIATISKTNAAGVSIRSPKISGTYNGLFIKTSNYIVPTPSIINSEVDGTELVLDVDNIKSQVIDGGKNIPNVGNVNTSTGNLTGLLLSVYEGTIEKDDSDSEKALVMQKIQDAYTGSSLASDDIYKYILGISGTEDLASLLDTVVLDGNTAVASSTDIIPTIPTINFETVLYTGTAGTNPILMTNIDSGVDFVWVKNRDAAGAPAIMDSLRGDNKVMYSSSTSPDSTENSFLFTDNSFTVGSSHGGSWNDSGNKYVAWVSSLPIDKLGNTDGSITADIKTNGWMSAISYTGNGIIGETVGHGLDGIPELTLIKRRNSSSYWVVKANNLGLNNDLYFNSTNAVFGDSTPTGGSNGSSYFFNNLPNSSVLELKEDYYVNGNTDNYIAYAFTSKAGVSKIGNYTGTSGSGNTINLGFEPQFLLVKNTSASSAWMMIDNIRDTDGELDTILAANATTIESGFGNTNRNVLFNTDSFTIGTTIAGGLTDLNTTGNNYIYLAIAKQQ